MNGQLDSYARKTLKEGLAQCTEGQQLMFKKMYSHNNLDMDIDDVVDAMEQDRLNRAMEQVESTLAKNKS